MTVFWVLLPFVKVGIICWLFSAIVIQLDIWFGLRLTDRLRAVLRWMYLEIKPFFLYFLTFDLIADALRHPPSLWDALLFANSVFAYYIMRNLDDDDRWKRRKAKLIEMVSVAEGKLVVVPSPNR